MVVGEVVDAEQATKCADRDLKQLHLDVTAEAEVRNDPLTSQHVLCMSHTDTETHHQPQIQTQTHHQPQTQTHHQPHKHRQAHTREPECTLHITDTDTDRHIIDQTQTQTDIS